MSGENFEQKFGLKPEEKNPSQIVVELTENNQPAPSSEKNLKSVLDFLKKKNCQLAPKAKELLKKYVTIKSDRRHKNTLHYLPKFTSIIE